MFSVVVDDLLTFPKLHEQLSLLYLLEGQIRSTPLLKPVYWGLALVVHFPSDQRIQGPQIVTNQEVQEVLVDHHR